VNTFVSSCTTNYKYGGQVRNNASIGASRRFPGADRICLNSEPVQGAGIVILKDAVQAGHQEDGQEDGTFRSQIHQVEKVGDGCLKGNHRQNTYQVSGSQIDTFKYR